VSGYLTNLLRRTFDSSAVVEPRLSPLFGAPESDPTNVRPAPLVASDYGNPTRMAQGVPPNSQSLRLDERKVVPSATLSPTTGTPEANFECERLEDSSSVEGRPAKAIFRANDIPGEDDRGTTNSRSTARSFNTPPSLIHLNNVSQSERGRVPSNENASLDKEASLPPTEAEAVYRGNGQDRDPRKPEEKSTRSVPARRSGTSRALTPESPQIRPLEHASNLATQRTQSSRKWHEGPSLQSASHLGESPITASIVGSTNSAKASPSKRVTSSGQSAIAMIGNHPPQFQAFGRRDSEWRTEPTIEVTIGRIDVRSGPVSESQRVLPQRKGSNLEEYLRRRSGGRE
jgi:hypothetical protein